MRESICKPDSCQGFVSRKVLSLENVKVCQTSTMKEQLENRQETWRDMSLKGVYRWQISTIKRCSTLLTIRELQTKTIRRCSVTQLCLILCNPVNYSPTGSSVHRIFLARILGLIAISSPRGSSWPRDRICVSCIRGFFTTEPPGKPLHPIRFPPTSLFFYFKEHHNFLN